MRLAATGSRRPDLAAELASRTAIRGACGDVSRHDARRCSISESGKDSRKRGRDAADAAHVAADSAAMRERSGARTTSSRIVRNLRQLAKTETTRRPPRTRLRRDPPRRQARRDAAPPRADGPQGGREGPGHPATRVDRLREGPGELGRQPGKAKERSRLTPAARRSKPNSRGSRSKRPTTSSSATRSCRRSCAGSSPPGKPTTSSCASSSSRS